MQEGNVLQPTIKSLATYDKLAVQRAVRFILNDANVQRISWGTLTVLLNGEEVDFPKLIRKRIVEYMLRDLVELYGKALTASDQKAKKAVDSKFLLYSLTSMSSKL